VDVFHVNLKNNWNKTTLMGFSETFGGNFFMNLFTIDEKKCTRDGICVKECPSHIIELKDGSPIPTPVKFAEKGCIRCGHCVVVCPHGALSHSLIKIEKCPPLQNDIAFTPEQAEYFLRSRRSIRQYQDRAIEPEKLKKLIEIARYAPTGGNSQQVKWLVINSRERVQKISGLVVDFMRSMVQNKQAIAESYRLDRLVTAWDAGIDIISRGAPSLVFAFAPKNYGVAAVDCTIALSYLDLAAPSLGLGCCWAGFIMMAIAYWPPLQQELALSEGYSSFGAMMVGYPKYRYYRLPERKEPEIVWR
jgi:nitroreductase/NAD-dependent dihydropyrimidine dehydrogenase PreA subunit